MQSVTPTQCLADDIYRDDIVFRDTRNVSQGKQNYKPIWWSLRFHGALFFSRLRVDVKRIWQPEESIIRSCSATSAYLCHMYSMAQHRLIDKVPVAMFYCLLNKTSLTLHISLQTLIAAAVSFNMLAAGCRLRWTVHGIPRVPWEAEGVFDGISEYKLDSEGKIYEHKVTNVQMRDPPFARSPLSIGLNLVQMPRLQGARQVRTTVFADDSWL